MLHRADTALMVRQLLLAHADPTLQDAARNLPGGKDNNGQNLLHVWGEKDELLRELLLSGQFQQHYRDREYNFLSALDASGQPGAVLSFSERRLYDTPDRAARFGQTSAKLPNGCAFYAAFLFVPLALLQNLVLTWHCLVEGFEAAPQRFVGGLRQARAGQVGPAPSANTANPPSHVDTKLDTKADPITSRAAPTSSDGPVREEEEWTRRIAQAHGVSAWLRWWCCL